MIKGIFLSILLAPPIVAAIIIIVQVPHLFFLCNPPFVFIFLTSIFIKCAFKPFWNHTIICHISEPEYLINLFFSVSLQNGGPYLAIYLWGFMFALALLMMTIYPIMIAPLFNKFTPVSVYFRQLHLLYLRRSICFCVKMVGMQAACATLHLHSKFMVKLDLIVTD
jgi:hypothetical protein